MDPDSNAFLDVIGSGGHLADDYLQRFPVEIQVAIVERMSPREILKLCQTSRYFAVNFCDQDPQYLWQKLFRRDISTLVRPPIIDRRSAYRQEYLRIMKRLGELKPEDAILEIAGLGYEQLLYQLLGKHPSLEQLNKGLVGSALAGRLDMVNELISRGANALNDALAYAAKYGNRQVVERLIQPGQLSTGQPSAGATDLNRALTAAARNGHSVIVSRLIRLGANDFNQALLAAAEEGHIEIVNQMIQRGANNLDGALLRAAKYGHADIAARMVQLGATNFNPAMRTAARGDHWNVIKRLIDLGAPPQSIRIAFVDAASYNNRNIVENLVALGLTTQSGYDDGLVYAAMGGHREMIERMVLLGAKDFDRAFKQAARVGCVKVMEQMLQYGASDFDGAMLFAAAGNHLNIVNWMVNLGAKNFNETLLLAAGLGYLDIAKRMIELGATDIHPAILRATDNGQQDMVDYLESIPTN